MIRRLLYRFHKWVWDYRRDEEEVVIYATNTKSRSGGNAVAGSGRNQPEVDGMRFVVMPARGGTIIQMSQYERKRDEHNFVTYVIPEGEDIATEVGKIVSVEMVKL